MRTPTALALLGLGLVLPLGVPALGAPALLGSWAACLAGLVLLLRAPRWRHAAWSGLALLNALVALAVAGALGVALAGGRTVVSATGLELADAAVAAGVLAASLAGALTLMLASTRDLRAMLVRALLVGALALAAVPASGAPAAHVGVVETAALAYALLTLAWGLALHGELVARPSPRADGY